MVEHGATGLLGGTDEQAAHTTAVLAYDEGLRFHVARAARLRLEQTFVTPVRQLPLGGECLPVGRWLLRRHL